MSLVSFLDLPETILKKRLKGGMVSLERFELSTTERTGNSAMAITISSLKSTPSTPPVTRDKPVPSKTEPVRASLEDDVRAGTRRWSCLGPNGRRAFGARASEAHLRQGLGEDGLCLAQVLHLWAPGCWSLLPRRMTARRSRQNKPTYLNRKNRHTALGHFSSGDWPPRRRGTS